jgi:polyamine oxidase
MQRKDFIKMASLGILSLPFSAFGHAKQQGKSKKVIVIGAGIAGASAARRLKDAGCEVIVLEARKRVGGRIHTNTELNTNIELGANWLLDAPSNPLTTFAEQLNLQKQKTSYSSIKMYDRNGDKIGKLCFGLFYQSIEKKLKLQADLIKKSGVDVSMQHVIDKIKASKKYSNKQQDMLSLMEEIYADDLATDLNNASANHSLNTSVRNANKDYFVLGGYSRIVENMLKDIDVHLDNAVVEIKNKADNVEILTKNKVYEADFVIITVPLSILQKKIIQFTPQLPEWKTQSFSKMQMGVFNKVVMQFSEKFWSGNADFQYYKSDMGHAFGLAVNYHNYRQKPILIALPVDKAGLFVEQNDVETVKKKYQDLFHKAHKGKNIEFEKILITQWQSDVYAQGSYSHIPVGTTGSDFNNLKKEVGRVYFAGEAMAEQHHATVHGAFNSGFQEASKIINL